MPLTFAETLEQAIAAQPLTLERIAARLKEAGTPTSVTTLSYWQTGRSQPTRARSRRCLSELDHILGLQPGTLLGSLDSNPRWAPHAVMPSSESAAELIAELDLNLLHTWSRISTHDRLVIDSAGRESSQRVGMVMRAEVDGAQSWPIVIHQDSHVPGSVAAVREISGVHMDDVRILPEEHLTVVRATLPHPVSRGTCVSVEYEISWGAQSERSHRFERGLPSPGTTLVMEVEFRGPLPQRVRRYHQPDTHVADDIAYFDDIRSDGRSLQFVATDAPAGCHGMSFTW